MWDLVWRRPGFRVQLAFKFKLAGLSESGAVTMSRAFRRNGVRLMMEMPVTGCRATQGPWPGHQDGVTRML